MDKRTYLAAPDADAQFTKAIADMSRVLEGLLVNPQRFERNTDADGINKESDAEYRARIVATIKSRREPWSPSTCSSPSTRS